MDEANKGYKHQAILTSKILKIVSLTNAIFLLIIFGLVMVLSYNVDIKVINAQTFDKAITFPDVNITDTKNNHITTLDQEFIVIETNSSNNIGHIEVINPDFGLSPPFAKLIEGQRYIINPINDQDIQYTNASIKLAHVLFISPDVKKENADPEDPDQMTLGDIIDLGTKAVGTNGFMIPSNLTPGDYILYVYFKYPYGITGIFSNLVAISK